MRFLITAGLLLAATAASATDEPLLGSYGGGDTAAASVYGVLTVNAKTLSWRNLSTRCSVGYRIIADPPGTRFKDQTDHEFVTGPEAPFVTYLLKLNAAECTRGVRYLRLTFPFKNEYSYLALIELDAKRNPSGYMHFHRGDKVSL